MEAPTPVDGDGEASADEHGDAAKTATTDPAPTRYDIPVAHPDTAVNGEADTSAPIFDELVAERGTSPV